MEKDGVDNKSDTDLDGYAKSLLDELKSKLTYVTSHYRSPRQFEPASSDIFIDSWMKSGTTLMQNLVYQLFVTLGKVPTDPSGDKFRDISAVVPFIEMSPVCGVYHPIHPYEPNVWKSHATIDEFVDDKNHYSNNCKFLYCIRNGKDVARSFLDFAYDWLITVENQDVNQTLYGLYFQLFFMADDTDAELGPWFHHVKGWLDKSTDIHSKRDVQLKNVWFIIYEDLCKDMKQSIIDIAKFLNVHHDLNDTHIDFVLDKCSRKKMAMDSRFNDVMVSEGMGLDVKGGRRVRLDTEVGFKKYTLPQHVVDRYDDMFQKAFNFDNYEQLTDAIRKRNKRFREQQGW